jgi:TRAP-type C4-dicarboxylate transport system permease large subunit
MRIDLSHFGIVTVLAVEIGLLTPPFGISVFTVHNTLNDPDVSVEQIFAATLPFIGVMMIVLALVAVFPNISTLFL